MKRAKNGMGSIRRRKDGTWEGRYTTPDGRQRSVYAKDSKALAVKLREAQSKAASGPWREPSRMTVAEWLPIWLSEYKSARSQHTREAYAVYCRHITDHLGDVRLRSLTPAHVQKLLNDLQREGYAPSSVRSMRVILIGAINIAKSAGIIEKNPAEAVKPPKLAKHTFQVIALDDMPRFRAACSKQKYGNAILFMLYTGLRMGELRGLRWEDIDGTQMRVERQLTPTAGGYAITIPKNDERRTIILSAPAVDILKAEKVAQAEDRLKAGAEWKDDDLSKGLVFRQHSGRHLTGAEVCRCLRSIAQEMGYKQLRPHDMRHNHAVAALVAGADPKTVQHNLGHASAAMTLDMYAAYTSEAGTTAAEKLGAYWGEKKG